MHAQSPLWGSLKGRGNIYLLSPELKLNLQLTILPILAMSSFSLTNKCVPAHSFRTALKLHRTWEAYLMSSSLQQPHELVRTNFFNLAFNWGETFILKKKLHIYKTNKEPCFPISHSGTPTLTAAITIPSCSSLRYWLVMWPFQQPSP